MNKEIKLLFRIVVTGIAIISALEALAGNSIFLIPLIGMFIITMLPPGIIKMEDIKIKCEDCGVEFFWTAKSQERLAELKERGEIDIITTPKRCFECRIAKKQRIAEMKEKNKGRTQDRGWDNGKDW